MKTFVTLLAVVLLLTVAGPAFSMQEPEVSDPIAHLHLTPEQRRRIRMIAEDTKDERQAANRRVRQAQVALDQALDAELIDDSVIEQRINDLAAAQAAQLRMRIQFEMRIRRELRPEQLAMLRQLRLQVRDVMGAQRPQNQLNQRSGREALRPNQRNSVRPELPHRNIRQP